MKSRYSCLRTRRLSIPESTELQLFQRVASGRPGQGISDKFQSLSPVRVALLQSSKLSDINVLASSRSCVIYGPYTVQRALLEHRICTYLREAVKFRHLFEADPRILHSIKYTSSN